MIHLRGEQMVEHVHGCGEHHALICLASPPANNLRQAALSVAFSVDLRPAIRADSPALALGRHCGSTLRDPAERGGKGRAIPAARCILGQVWIEVSYASAHAHRTSNDIIGLLEAP